MSKSGMNGILNEAFYDALWVLCVSLAVAIGLALIVEPVRENILVVILPLLLFIGEFVFRICYRWFTAE